MTKLPSPLPWPTYSTCSGTAVLVHVVQHCWMWWVGMLSGVHAQRMVWCSGEGYHETVASQHITLWHGYIVPSLYSPYLTAVQGWCPRCMRHLSHLLSNCTLPPGHMVQREGQIQATMKQKVTTHTALAISLYCSLQYTKVHIRTLLTVRPNFA